MNIGQFEDIHARLQNLERGQRETNALLARIAAALEAKVGELVEPQSGYLWTNSPKPEQWSDASMPDAAGVPGALADTPKPKRGKKAS